MEILKTTIEWWHGYGNSPEVKMVVDKIPSIDDAIWRAVPNSEARENTMLISTNQTPILRFKYINDPTKPENVGGACGGVHKMEDGSIFMSRCGWSSRVGVINKDFFDYLPGGEEFVEVPLLDNSSRYSSLYFAGLSLPVSLVKKHVEALGYHLVRQVKFDGEPYWIPSVDSDMVVKKGQ